MKFLTNKTDKKILEYGGQDHNRFVYEDGEYCIKMWSTNYVRGEFFYKAYNKNFFDFMDIYIEPILISNKCCGYKMNKCEESVINEKEFEILQQILIEKIIRTGYFYYDFHKDNIKKFKNKFVLIDLDSIYPFFEYKKWCNKEHYLKKNIKVDGSEQNADKMMGGNSNYRKKIDDLYEKIFKLSK